MGRRGRLSIQDESTFFVTTTVVQHAHVFTCDKYCDILIGNIRHYQRRYQFRIFGYVIMPSHFHWILEVDATRGNLSDVMRDIKKYSAWDLMEEIRKDGRNKLLDLFNKAAYGYARHKRKFWMPRFNDLAIRSAPLLKTKLDYIHNNPVRAGLVENPEEYKYSSARNHILGDQSVLYVDSYW